MGYLKLVAEYFENTDNLCIAITARIPVENSWQKISITISSGKIGSYEKTTINLKTKDTSEIDGFLKGYHCKDDIIGIATKQGYK